MLWLRVTLLTAAYTLATVAGCFVLLVAFAVLTAR